MEWFEFTFEASQLDYCAAPTIASRDSIFSGHNCWPLSVSKYIYNILLEHKSFLWLVESVHDSPGTALRVLFSIQCWPLIVIRHEHCLGDALSTLRSSAFLLDLKVQHFEVIHSCCEARAVKHVQGVSRRKMGTVVC